MRRRSAKKLSYDWQVRLVTSPTLSYTFTQAKDVAHGLGYLHELEIIHGDLKAVSVRSAWRKMFPYILYGYRSSMFLSVSTRLRV